MYLPLMKGTNNSAELIWNTFHQPSEYALIDAWPQMVDVGLCRRSPTAGKRKKKSTDPSVK